MTKDHFLQGMGLGMAAGVAISMAMVPKKRMHLKRAASKAMRTVGEAVDTLTDAMEQ